MSTITKVPMTANGVQQLRSELHELKTTARPTVIAAIAEARAHGDLKENAEYHAAREQQGFIEGRIKDIETKLSCAHIINITDLDNDGKVIFGATVKLLNMQTQQIVQYQIVGDDEADFKQGKISVNTPIAKAIISKFEGDLVNVQTPNGLIQYTIDIVEYK